MLLQLIEAHFGLKIVVFTQAITRLLRYFFYLSCYFFLFFVLSISLPSTTAIDHQLWQRHCLLGYGLYNKSDIVSNLQFRFQRREEPNGLFGANVREPAATR